MMGGSRSSRRIGFSLRGGVTEGITVVRDQIRFSGGVDGEVVHHFPVLPFEGAATI